VDWMVLIAAFGGGLFGAALGAVPVFIFTGVLALLGVAAAASGHLELLQVAFGPVLGPHVSFGGGVAAAAYAGSRGVLKTGRDIGSPLMGVGRMDVLLVGGAFGSLGYALNAAFVATGAAAWTDSVAVTVVITGIAARYMFGHGGLMGRLPAPPARRFRPTDSATWLPWQQDWQHVLVIGAGVGLVSAYLTGASGLQAGRETLGFAISTVSLVFLVMGNKIPVTHHISLTAALAVIHGGGLITGAVTGVLGAVLGEVASRTTLIHGDTHIDPPAVAIGLVATILLTMRAAGVTVPPF
jgi:hypothetical protein